jgi:mannose-6-phosphate isomerase-like protein (cupin superfamily)
MKFSLEEFAKVGKVVKDNDVYTVTDVRRLQNLVVSLTVLHPGKETGGHSHDGAEEVYNFEEGSGEMQLGDERFPVSEGDIVVIPKSAFHKVFNTGSVDMKFVCVFEKYGDRA